MEALRLRPESLQGGFDVDIYGVNPRNELAFRGLMVITRGAAPGYRKSPKRSPITLAVLASLR